jgi:glycerol kinase
MPPYKTFGSIELSQAQGTIAEIRGLAGRDSMTAGPAELAQAVLESVCYQTFDLWAAMRADWPEAKAANIVRRVDGG